MATACCCTVVRKRFPGRTSKHVVTRDGQKNVTKNANTNHHRNNVGQHFVETKMENLFMFGFDSKTQNPCIKNNFKTHSSIPHNITRNRARSTKYKTRSYQEVATCGSKVAPELRFASSAKQRLVEKRLPIGDRFLRVQEKQKVENMFHVLCKQKSVPHCGDDFICLHKIHNFLRPCRVTICLEAFLKRPLWPLCNHMTGPHYDHMS